MATCACLSPALQAQTPDTATVHGQVTDASHAAISGAQITATNTLTRLKRSARTDDSGRFSLSAMPVAGSYEIAAVKEGFADAA